MRAYDNDFSLTSPSESPHRLLEGGRNQESNEDCYVALGKVGF